MQTHSMKSDVSKRRRFTNWDKKIYRSHRVGKERKVSDDKIV